MKPDRPGSERSIEEESKLKQVLGKNESSIISSFSREVELAQNLPDLLERMEKPEYEQNEQGEKRYLKDIVEGIRQAVGWKSKAKESGAHFFGDSEKENLMPYLSGLSDSEAAALIGKLVELVDKEPDYLDARQNAERIEKFNAENERKKYENTEEEIQALGNELDELKEAQGDARATSREDLDRGWEELIPEEQPSPKKQERENTNNPEEKGRPWWKRWFGL